MAELARTCLLCTVTINPAVEIFCCHHLFCVSCADPFRFCPVCYRVRHLTAASATITFAQRLEAFLAEIEIQRTSRLSRREE